MSAPAVRIVHSAVAGRVRFAVSGLKGRPRTAERLQARLLALPGVRAAQASALTGRVLLRFDPSWQSLRSLARQTAAAIDLASQPGQPPETLLESWNGSLPPALAAPGGSSERALWTRHCWSASVTPADVLRELGVPNADGLPEAEASRRAVGRGSRALPSPSRRATAEILREQFVTVPNGLLAGAMGVAALTHGGWDAAVIGTVVLLNGVIGYFTEHYAESAVEALRRLGFPLARVIRAGQHQNIPAEQLVPGDVVRLRSGDLVPADARVTEGTLLVDEAMLTGESEPVPKHWRPIDPPGQIHEFQNMVFQGTAVADGRARAVVLATGRDTELGRIHALVSGTTAPRTRLQEEMDRLGRTLGFGAAGICAALFAVAALRRQPLLSSLQTAVSLAVSAVPEGLPAIATTALAVGMRRMLRRQVIIRKLPSVEALGSLTVLCVDKTGTLTLNRMTASRYWWEGQLYRFESRGAPGRGIYREGHRRLDPRSTPALDAMLRVGVLCNEAKLRREKGGLHVSGSATEGALLLAAHAAGYWFEDLRAQYRKLTIHRRAQRSRRMVSVHRDPAGGLRVAVKGSPEAVLELCDSRLDAGGQPLPLTPADRERYRQANQRLSEDGLRVLAFAWGRKEERAAAPDLHGLTWLGLVGLEDPIRPGVAEAIRRCDRAGVRTVILTGDQRGTAVAVARTLGLDDGRARVLEAADLEQMPADQIAPTVANTAVFARVSPEHKLRIVQALQASGQVVAMTGDGINDGPALKVADIGIAMGGEGSSDVARELADVVLTRNDFESIVTAVEQGRVIFANIRRALRYLLSTNVSELLLAGVTLLAGIPFPFRPTQILWINLVSDVFPALALVLEPTDREVMRQPPRAPGTPVVTRREWAGLCADAAVIGTGSLGAYLWAARRYGFGPVASAVALTATTIGEALYALACSGAQERQGVAGRGAGHHSALLGTVAGSIGLQLAVNHWRPLQRLLHGAPLRGPDYGVAVAAALLPMAWALLRQQLAAARRPSLPAVPAAAGPANRDQEATAPVLRSA
jgi:Ca2+-transporting ATPase